MLILLYIAILCDHSHDAFGSISLQSQLVGTSQVSVDGATVLLGSTLATSISVGRPQVTALSFSSQVYTVSATSSLGITVGGPVTVTGTSVTLSFVLL